MRRFLPATITTALLTLFSSANAGQVWTDGDGDGLPDSGPLSATPSTNVTVGVWVDSQSFTYTNYLIYVEHDNSCITYVSASYAVIHEPTFPIDNFSNPNAIGFGVTGINQSGVDQIGFITYHIDTPTACCVEPIIDPYNPYYTFSQLGAGSAYMLFTTNPSTCYNGPATGACCFPNGTCAITTSDECAASGGAYAGDGSDCTACDITATESKTWGRIKGLFR